MSETYQFGLPLLAAGQAQKHVTVNENLAILDAVSQLRVESMTVAEPPVAPLDGVAFVIPPGALDDWAGREGDVAISVNSGWRYVTPKAGWQAFNVETGTHQLFDGVEWLDCTLAASTSGASLEFKVVDLDHTIEAGSTSLTSQAIEGGSMVFGVSGRVVETITGTLSSWSLGVTNANNRYGSSLGLSRNSYVSGLTGTPVTYYGPTSLQLTAEGGAFEAGRLILSVHLLQLKPPRPIT